MIKFAPIFELDDNTFIFVGDDYVAHRRERVASLALGMLPEIWATGVEYTGEVATIDPYTNCINEQPAYEAMLGKFRVALLSGPEYELSQEAEAKWMAEQRDTPDFQEFYNAVAEYTDRPPNIEKVLAMYNCNYTPETAAYELTGQTVLEPEVR